MSEINEALKQIEATEANFRKLEKAWEELLNLLPTDYQATPSPQNATRYENLSRHFKHILSAMPKIDGFEISYSILSFSSVLSGYIHYQKFGDIAALLSFTESVHSQGNHLAEYRFRLSQKRKELAQQVVFGICDSIETDLATLQGVKPNWATQDKDDGERIDHPAWDEISRKLGSIAVIVGSAVKLPFGWTDMTRHISFREKNDLRNIIKSDWPSIKSGLEDSLRNEFDPIPVKVDDIGALVSSRPSGNVITGLRWNLLAPNDFERLIFNLISDGGGYENSQWLTHTNAPDKGRDLSVYRVVRDNLAETRRLRVIIACKHYLKQPVDIKEFGTLKEQILLWEPPKVDELIIATSGRFTTQLIEAIERHNEKTSFHVELWPDSKLELLLSKRPDLIAGFKLR